MKAIVIYDHSDLGLGYLAAAYFSYFADKKGGCRVDPGSFADAEVLALLQEVLMEDNLSLDPALLVGQGEVLPQVQIHIAGALPTTDSPLPGVYHVSLPDNEPNTLPMLEKYREYRDAIKREMLRIIGKEDLFGGKT